MVAHLLGLLATGPAWSQATPPAVWPGAVLSNANIRLVAYAPVPDTGYYQAVRFDWSSLLGEIDVGGHRFFINHHAGKHDPRGHDNVAGPAEEFDLETPPPGFADARTNGTFLKIGVGVLRRPDEKAYSFGRAYEVADHGTWGFTPVGSTSVVYRHTVTLPDRRLGYVLERRLSLAAEGRRLLIGRSLRNTGTQPLRTRHYAHNFVQIDDHPIGRDYRVEWSFVPHAVKPEQVPAAGIIEGQTLGFVPEQLERTFWISLGGFSSAPEQNRVTVRHVPSGAAVSFATDRPLCDFRVYANQRILCPEPFTDIDLAPGDTVVWNTQIAFTPPRGTP
jgi:hypothetical protein